MFERYWFQNNFLFKEYFRDSGLFKFSISFVNRVFRVTNSSQISKNCIRWQAISRKPNHPKPFLENLVLQQSVSNYRHLCQVISACLFVLSFPFVCSLLCLTLMSSVWVSLFILNLSFKSISICLNFLFQ